MASQPPKLLSKDVHKHLRDAWGAPLKATGWKRSKLSSSAWSLATDTDAVSFWVQIDKYGWWDGFGSELTVEFQYDAGAPSSLPGGFQDRDRYVQFLSDQEIAAVLDANRRVRASLPPDPPKAFPGFDPYPNDLQALTIAPDLARRFDLWMRYYLPEHLQWIADFLLPRIDGIARQMLDNRRRRRLQTP
jgi:hypothetical protein